MISKRKIILYFGFAGILPASFYLVQKFYLGTFDSLNLKFVLTIFIGLAMGYIITASVSAAVISSISFLDKIVPWEKGVWKRIITEFFYTNIVAVLAITILGQFSYLINVDELPYKDHMIQGVIIAIILNLFLTTFYEGIRLFSNWKKSLIETERLAKENISSKFEALKNQVNPHFLFNSLNTLSSLIYSDTKKAEIFIDEFASIYRYVLDNRDNLVVSLKDEIGFIKSFVYLLQIRFGEGLIFNIRIDSEKLLHHLPTLSLQLLVENAIKHNVVTKENPLNVAITNEEDVIVVTNNLQEREEHTESTGIGLSNLKQRYQLLSYSQPEFMIKNDQYIARLPLILPE